MLLLVDELYTTLFQEVTANRDFDLTAIRPHIYKHNAPAGNLKIQLQDLSGNLIAESDTVDIADIPETAVAFSHRYVRFFIDQPIKEGLSYRIVLVPGGGYSFSEGAYIGWCRDFDLRKNDALFSPSTGYASALDFEAWELKGGLDMPRELDFSDGFDTATEPERPSADLAGGIVNNQASPANITGLVFASTIRHAWVMVSLFRKTTSGPAVSNSASGILHVQLEDGVWSVEPESQHDTFATVGITFSIAAGQVKYTSTNYAGAGYTSGLKYTVLHTFTA